MVMRMPMEGVQRMCPVCGDAVAAEANFCGRCGRSLSATASPAKGRWYHNIVFVLVMLFFVLGPFGLPLVWKNPRFSRPVKLILTALTIGYTLWLVQLTVAMSKAVMESVRQFNSTLQ